jgi:hypothetical protein
MKIKKIISIVMACIMMMSIATISSSALTITNNSTQRFVTVTFNQNTCPRAFMFTQTGGALVTATGGDFTINLSALNNATITSIVITPGNPVMSGNLLQLRNLYFSRSNSTVSRAHNNLAAWTINNFNGSPVNGTYRFWFDGTGHQMQNNPFGNYSLPNVSIRINYQI